MPDAIGADAARQIVDEALMPLAPLLELLDAEIKITHKPNLFEVGFSFKRGGGIAFGNSGEPVTERGVRGLMEFVASQLMTRVAVAGPRAFWKT